MADKRGSDRRKQPNRRGDGDRREAEKGPPPDGSERRSGSDRRSGGERRSGKDRRSDG
jgi:hypothetical protein